MLSFHHQFHRRLRLVCLVGLLATMAIGPGCGQSCGCQPTPGPTKSPAAAPDPWSGSPARTVTLGIEQSAAVLTTGASDLRFHLPGSNPEWTHDEWRDRQRLTGTSTIPTTGDQPARLIVRMHLADGNPQILFTSSLESPANARPTDRVTLSVDFPPGGNWRQFRRTSGKRLQEVTAPISIPPFQYPWLQFRADKGVPITIHGWNGDGISLARERGTRTTLSLHLWRPSRQDACQRTSPADSTRRARATIAIGQQRPIAISMLPEGYHAGIVPVFLPPKIAANPPLWRGGPDSPNDWKERVETLAFGHSNPDDPRYGNGGLIGRNLGATIAWPDALFDLSLFSMVDDDIASASVDLAAPLNRSLLASDSDGSGANAPSSDVRTALQIDDADERPNCADVSPTPQIIVRDGPTIGQHLPTPLSPNDSISEGTFSTPFEARPVVATVAHTDGSRRTLTESLLSNTTINRLAKHREVMTLGIPLIATRNPLLPAFDQALLSPERHHQWTLQPSFSSALTTLNFAGESHDVGVLGLGQLVRHWRRARHTMLRWTQKNTLRITSQSERPIPGFTLLYNDSHPDSTSSLATESSGIKHSAIWSLDAEQATQLTWPESSPRLKAVEWVFKK